MSLNKETLTTLRPHTASYFVATFRVICRTEYIDCALLVMWLSGGTLAASVHGALRFSRYVRFIINKISGMMRIIAYDKYLCTIIIIVYVGGRGGRGFWL